ncbi:hypothetical protein ACLMJK_009697 [Lecanora helva]
MPQIPEIANPPSPLTMHPVHQENSLDATIDMKCNQEDMLSSPDTQASTNGKRQQNSSTYESRPFPERPNGRSSLSQKRSHGDSNQRPFFLAKHIISDSDSSPFYIDPSHPKRSATLPPNLQSKAISRILCEDIDPASSNPKRQETFDTKNSESFEESAPWDQKAILSLDGGGIRGYSALLIIRAIMEAIKAVEMKYPDGDGPAESSYHPLSSNPEHIMGTRVPQRENRQASKWLPCHYFDYMAGTSTGGLIAIMLGRLRMNIDDCISDYETLGGQVFGHSRWFHLRSPLWWPRDKYNHEVLKQVVMNVVKERAPKIDSFPGGQNFSFDENRCRTVVVSYQQPKETAGLEKPYLFRTYKNLHLDEESQGPGDEGMVRNPGEAQDIPIWEVARATSAAPTYFKPVEIDGRLYLDGGFGANNPCGEIVDEVRSLNNQAVKCVKIVVSVGTGKNKESGRLKNKGPTRFINFMNVAKKWASDSEREHEWQRRKSRDPITGFRYFRLNVEDGLGTMKLDEWRSRRRLRTTAGRAIGKLRLSRRDRENQAGDENSVNSEKAMSTTNDSGVFVAKEDFHQADNNNKEVTQQSMQKEESISNQAVMSGAEDKDQCKIPTWFEPKSTLDTIREHTQVYLQRDDVQRHIQDLAFILVEGRRERAMSNPQRWEKTCFGTWYQCKLAYCPRGEKEYLLRDKMAHHILDKHKDAYSKDDQPKLQRALDDCKIVVL